MRKINIFSWITFLTAFCALSYELILAQLCAAFSSETAVCYIVMFALYIPAYRFGSSLAGKSNARVQLLYLLRNNIILNFLGGLSVIFFLRIVCMSRFEGLAGIMAAGLMIGIGFLAGRLTGLARSHVPANPGFCAEESFLSVDLGNFCAAIIFVLFIYPKIGLLSGVALIGFGQALMGCGLFAYRKLLASGERKVFYGYWIFQSLLGVIFILMFINSARIYDYFLVIYLN